MDKFANQAIGLQAGNMPRPASPFTAVHSTMDDAVTLATRVQVLAERLLGGAPRDSKGGAVAPVPPSGEMYVLADRAATTDQHIRDAFDALTRIEAVLP